MPRLEVRTCLDFHQTVADRGGTKAASRRSSGEALAGSEALGGAEVTARRESRPRTLPESLRVQAGACHG